MVWPTLHGYGDIVVMLQLLFRITTREECRHLSHLVPGSLCHYVIVLRWSWYVDGKIGEVDRQSPLQPMHRGHIYRTYLFSLSLYTPSPAYQPLASDYCTAMKPKERGAIDPANQLHT